MKCMCLHIKSSYIFRMSSACYPDFVKKRLKRRFLISDISADNITLFLLQDTGWAGFSYMILIITFHFSFTLKVLEAEIQTI